MRRRRYLATVPAALSGIALAGCSDDSGTDGASGDGPRSDSGDGDGDEGTETAAVEDPASQLDVSGYLTASDAGGAVTFQAEIDAENSASQDLTADFSAAIAPFGGGREMASESLERAIPSGERDEFTVDIVDAASMDFEQLTGIYFDGFQLRIAVNGEPRPEVCSNEDVVEPNEAGCRYPFGIYETFVEVEYDGNWQGAFGSEQSQRTVERASADFGAPEGFETSYVNIDDDAGIVSANAQKQDDSSEELTIRIVHRNGVYAEQTTSGAYGVAQVVANLETDSPIREREAGEAQAEPAVTPAFSPEEFIEFLVTVAYDDPEDRYRDADDAERSVGRFIHPDRRNDVVLGHELPSPAVIVDEESEFELQSTEVIGGDASDEAVVRAVYTRYGERVDQDYELRLGSDGEWLIWDVTWNAGSPATPAGGTPTPEPLLFTELEVGVFQPAFEDYYNVVFEPVLEYVEGGEFEFEAELEYPSGDTVSQSKTDRIAAHTPVEIELTEVWPEDREESAVHQEFQDSTYRVYIDGDEAFEGSCSDLSDIDVGGEFAKGCAFDVNETVDPG